MTLISSIGPSLARFYRFRWSFSILLLLAFDFCTWMAFRESGGRAMFPHQDKVMHCLAFMGLFTLGHLSLHFDFFPKRKPGPWLQLCHWTIWLGYGLFIEMVQRLIDYRSASLGDFLADVVGICLGAALVTGLRLHPRSGKQ